MTTPDETPQPCDCCHTEDGTWTVLPLTAGPLDEPELVGARMRLLTHAVGEDGRLHLAAVAEGLFEGAHVDDGGNIDGVALLPDPDAPGMSRMWKATADEALERRRASLAAGGPPSRELWGPLVVGRHVLQVAR